MAEMMSFRIPTRTRLQMDRLSSRYHSMTAVVVAAVDRLYQQEVGMSGISDRHEARTAQFRRIRTIGDAQVGYIATTIGEVAAVRYADGTTFTIGDWDSPQPDMTDHGDIAEAWWVDADGRDAVMLNGLPRLAPWATTEGSVRDLRLVSTDPVQQWGWLREVAGNIWANLWMGGTEDIYDTIAEDLVAIYLDQFDITDELPVWWDDSWQSRLVAEIQGYAERDTADA